MDFILSVLLPRRRVYVKAQDYTKVTARMPPKLPAGQRLAPGFWVNPWRRRMLESQPDRVRVWQQDKLITAGKVVLLYQPVRATTPGAVRCTCLKATNQQSDRPCNTCYGTTWAPGFTLFLHDTLFWSSAEAGTFTLTGCEIDTVIKPNRVVLSDGQLSGTIVTTAKAYANPGTAPEAPVEAGPTDWETQTDAAVRSAGSTVVVEFSTDSGATWSAIAAINGAGQPVNTGTVMLRITLTRASVDDEGPAWEITRIRRPAPERENPHIARFRDDYVTGAVLMLRTPVIQQLALDPQRGLQVGHGGDRGWTAPLDFYDLTLPREDPSTRIDDDEGGPHPFYEHPSGVFADRRYVMTSVSYSTELGVFTAQSWTDRLAQGGESVWLVF